MNEEGSAMTLTGDDLAIAISACAHAETWCKKQGRSKYWRHERQKYAALAGKLLAVIDYAYPYLPGSESAGELCAGAEQIMRLDGRVVRKTRAAAVRTGR